MPAIHLKKYFQNYAQDKDIARNIRETQVLPAISKKNQKVVFDFSGVDFATQSCMHALFSDILQKSGESALQKMEFKNVKSPELRQIITIVVNYSLN